MNKENYTDKERLLIVEQDIHHIVSKMDSHHHDAKMQISKLYDKIDKMPTGNDIEVSFTKNAQRFVDGLSKRIDDNRKYCESENENFNNEIQKLREDRARIIGASAVLSVIFASFIKFIWDKLP